MCVKAIILELKDGAGQGLCYYNPRQKCKQFQTKPWSFSFVFDPIPIYILVFTFMINKQRLFPEICLTTE